MGPGVDPRYKVRMSTRTRLIVLFASVPVIAFTLVGGFLGRVAAGEDAYRHLRIFEDVVSLISNNYVEEVDLDDVIDGALRGLAEGLDADSAYLAREDADRLESGQPLPAGGIGVEVTRRYYIQIVAVADDSPAARAGLLPGDFIRAIDGEPTRFMSGVVGERRLRSEPGSRVTISLIRGSTQEPYDIELVRERLGEPTVSRRMLADAVGYVRVPGFGSGVADAVRDAATGLVDDGALTLVLDVRNNATGAFEEGIAAARLFVGDGTLVIREEHGERRTPIEAGGGNPAIETTMILLVNTGTAGPAELFAAALVGRERAELVGQRTAGRVGLQKLVRLPGGEGLWISWARYLKASGDPIHRYGVEPTIAVEATTTELGELLPTDDTVLERALEHLSAPL